MNWLKTIAYEKNWTFISAAGHEASGTGSMKFLMNGCLLLATEDGSTVEIIKEIGAENMVWWWATLNIYMILGYKCAFQ